MYQLLSMFSPSALKNFSNILWNIAIKSNVFHCSSHAVKVNKYHHVPFKSTSALDLKISNYFPLKFSNTYKSHTTPYGLLCQVWGRAGSSQKIYGSSKKQVLRKIQIRLSGQITTVWTFNLGNKLPIIEAFTSKFYCDMLLDCTIHAD